MLSGKGSRRFWQLGKGKLVLILCPAGKRICPQNPATAEHQPEVCRLPATPTQPAQLLKAGVPNLCWMWELTQSPLSTNVTDPSAQGHRTHQCCSVRGKGNLNGPDLLDSPKLTWELSCQQLYSTDVQVQLIHVVLAEITDLQVSAE